MSRGFRDVVSSGEWRRQVHRDKMGAETEGRGSEPRVTEGHQQPGGEGWEVGRG